MNKIGYKDLQKLVEGIISELSSDNKDISQKDDDLFKTLKEQIQKELRHERLRVIGNLPTILKSRNSSNALKEEKKSSPEISTKIFPVKEPYHPAKFSFKDSVNKMLPTGFFSSLLFSDKFWPVIVVLLVLLAMAVVYTRNHSITSDLPSVSRFESARTKATYPKVIKKTADADKLFQMALGELKKNNIGAAREYLRLALTLEPENEEFLNQMKKIGR